MKFMNKILNKKTENKPNEINFKKTSTIHVLGEDYFSPDNIITEDTITQEFQEAEKAIPNNTFNSSNKLPSASKQKVINKIMGEQKPQIAKKDKKEESDVLKGFILMNGEKKFRTDNCFIKIDENNFPCKVILTPYRVHIIPDFKKKNSNDVSYMNYFPDNYFSLLNHKIDKAIKTSNEKSFDFSLEIIMKDQRVFSLIFKNNSGGGFLDQLNGLLALREHSYLNIALEYKKNNPIYNKENFEDGWNLYNAEKEYERQGVTNLEYEVNKNKLFRKTKLNENYGLCPSYPKFLVTVGEITDAEYRSSAEFRTKSRLPTLAYYHPNTGGTIWRSAQTKSGLSGNRNKFDEDLLLYITKVSPLKKLYIYDCRPYLSAVANRLKGAGFENVENYPGSEIFFCEIDNIHSARNALNKIYSMLKAKHRFPENKKFFSSFENSGWPDFIYGIILACTNIASAVRKGYSVLIHCSDGWDRCSQLTAFSQLLIDPYFRTIKGYLTLIEKDFLSFGHQFRLRNGYYSKEEKSENQTSPILFQFLDATHQLLVQYPMYFEFNMKFLIFIANSINSGLYGTFLYNCDKDREKQNAKTKTMSCWTEILNNINQYKNQFYEEKARKIYFLTPNFSMHRIRLWDEYFLPFTQINLNISYDNYVNRFQENCYFNIFGQMKQKSRIISNVHYMIKEKENQKKNEENLKEQIAQLKNAISELAIKNNINKNFFESLSKETSDIIKDIANEKGGEINLNEELNMYCFKEIEKPIEIIEEENKLVEANDEPNNKGDKENLEDKNEIKNENNNENLFQLEKKGKKEEIKITEKEDLIKEDNKNIIKNENNNENIFQPEKIGKKEEMKTTKNEQSKKNSINQSRINHIFGLNKDENNKKIDKNTNKKDNIKAKENIENDDIEESKLKAEDIGIDKEENIENNNININKEGNEQMEIKEEKKANELKSKNEEEKNIKDEKILEKDKIEDKKEKIKIDDNYKESSENNN